MSSLDSSLSNAIKSYPTSPLSRGKSKRYRDEDEEGQTDSPVGGEEKTVEVFGLEFTKLTVKDVCSTAGGTERKLANDLEFELYQLQAIEALYQAAVKHARESKDGQKNCISDGGIAHGSIKVRFIITLEGQLYFALEGRPNPTYKVPAHCHMTDAVKFNEARCLAAGNVSILYQSGKYLIPFLSNKTSDFKLPANTLQWLLAILLKHNLLAEQIVVEKHDGKVSKGNVSLEGINKKIAQLYSTKELNDLVKKMLVQRFSEDVIKLISLR